MKKDLRKSFLTVLLAMILLSLLLAFSASAANEGPYIYEINGDGVTITGCERTIEGDVILPDTLGGIPVTAIGDRAFYYCGGITSIKIPESVKSIGANAFEFCGALYEVILPQNLTEIKHDTFNMCFNLSKINLGQTQVTAIGANAFDYCDYLMVVSIPDTVTVIGDSAFANCSNLETVIMGKGVTDIGKNAFMGCYNLRTVYCMTDEEQWKAVLLGEGNDRLTSAYFYYEHMHVYDSKVLVREATCLRDGAYTLTCRCTDSYDEYIKGEHTYKTKTTKATTSKDGKTVTACTLCSHIKKTTKIYKASTVKLSSTEVTYNGKKRTPSVTVKNSAGSTLKEGTHYTVEYAKDRKAPGKYAIKVVFKGSKYSGSKTLYLTIKPQTVELKSVTAKGAGKAELKWNKETADGYQIYFASSKDGKYKKVATMKSGSTISTVIGSMSKGKTYYFKVRAYKKTDSGTVYGSFSNVKSVRIK